MSRFFDIDSPVMRFLTKVADLMILNLLTILCCIPVITAGAAFTSMHYVLLKMARNEEGYIVKAFFKSFKENFRQATIIWLFVLAFILIIIGDLLIFNYSAMEFPKALKAVLFAVTFLVMMVMVYVFPVLSRFENTIWNTLKNALLMSILSLPKTLLMIILYVVPIAVIFFIPMAVPLVFLFGFSAPAYFAAMLYSGTFKRFEPEEEPIIDRFETGNGSDDITDN